jgi:hypothetical protein
MKDSFSWPGDIATNKKIGTWTGEIPSYFKVTDAGDFASEGNSIDATPTQKIDADLKSSALDIASYQVIQFVPSSMLYFSSSGLSGSAF